jgi:hypothetical protein
VLVVHGLPDDYYDEYRARVRGMTIERILEAAQRHFASDTLQMVVVGDPELCVLHSSDLGFGAVTPTTLPGIQYHEVRRTPPPPRNSKNIEPGKISSRRIHTGKIISLDV